MLVPGGSEYEPRQPQDTLLYQTVQAELESFLARARERGQPPPRFTEQELRAFLRCGILEHGFLRLQCDDCKLDRGASETFLRRLDVVPPALAIAQAAAESGWGTSRFAHKGNAVFGQRTWNRGKGLVPRRRDADQRHEVKSFSDIGDSVRAYMMNLNCHPAYESYRRTRAEMRAAGAAFDSTKLARALTRYAEIGEAYVAILHRIIRVNRLRELDRATLSGIETGA